MILIQFELSNKESQGQTEHSQNSIQAMYFNLTDNTASAATSATAIIYET